MFELILQLLFPFLIGTQAILLMVLTKGEICPGQRGRIHKLLPILVAGWLLGMTEQIVAIIPFLLLLFFNIKIQTGKTRNIGPLWAYKLSLLTGIIVWVVTLFSMGNGLYALYQLALVALLGAIGAHLLLTIARTRLQAFHQLLPVAGIFATILTILIFLIYLLLLPEQQLDGVLNLILCSFIGLIAGVAVWASHLLRQKSIDKMQLFAALLLLCGGVVIEASLFI
ncbi:hypothetical protein L0B53_16510 [Vibrio sp. SS-MA-C1-2]|uniref:hypothetical protein n=1 Tax=Vibrio sp. SS-MA-C1-2 TaxID=2908646 RepID=UPI001F419FFE|nr:hypothetical protein [Vibrio sp. SS-MA-C1-2]UJF18593.1 hypothetical protein L0B53_16510 [Vibrio sp. SS-MA-C1-2]